MAIPVGPTEHPFAALQDATELAALRADVDALSEELLNRYEEIALLYDLSRELGVVTDLESSSRTALMRTLQVIPARCGVIVVGSDPDALDDIASAGSDPGGRYTVVAHRAAGVAMRLVSQVMVHAGGLVDEQLRTADPVLAVPLLTQGDGAEQAMLELVGSELVKRAADRAQRREERLKAQREGRGEDEQQGEE